MNPTAPVNPYPYIMNDPNQPGTSSYCNLSAFLDNCDNFNRQYLWNCYSPEEFKKYLENKKVIVVIDNSGSMSTVISQESHLYQWGLVYNGSATRQHELILTMIGMIQVLSRIPESDIDVHFLNEIRIDGKDRRVFKNILSDFNEYSLFREALIRPPMNQTPLVTTLHQIFREFNGSSGNPHIVVFTDGKPQLSGERGGEYKNNEKDLKKLLKKYLLKKDSIFTMNIIVCTDNDNDVEYLNKLDMNNPRLDVTDEFITEYKQIKIASGGNNEILPENYDGYIYKALIGCLDPAVDTADEQVNPRKGCCTIS